MSEEGEFSIPKEELTECGTGSECGAETLELFMETRM
jgi:hypothetical protein